MEENIGGDDKRTSLSDAFFFQNSVIRFCFCINGARDGIF